MSETSRSPDPDLPPGWLYNPSSWAQRIPVIVLGIVGMCIGLYLAAFQLGLTHHVWDPVFGSGSERILTSRVSSLFPTSDALLGAIGYLFDWLFGAIGGTQRYRTMPWIVILFGIGIVPFGGISIGLGIAMRSIAGSWCFLCLASTLISFVMIPLSWDEIWLSLNEIRREMRGGASFWAALTGRAAERRGEEPAAARQSP